MFKSETIEVPAAVATGTPVDVSARSPVSFSLGGTFVATTKFQYSPVADGDVWYDVGSAMTAGGGTRFLPAGRAKRVRANTTAWTSGAGVACAMCDDGQEVVDTERNFVEETVEVPVVISTAGDAIALEDGEQATIHLLGTFVGTYQAQVCLSPTGSVWHSYGAPLTAAGAIRIPRGTAAQVRLYATAYTSGTPTGYLLRGLANEPGDDESIDNVTAPGALSTFTKVSLLTIDGADAHTLADGYYEGQEKLVRCIAATTSPVGTLTYNGSSTYKFWYVGQWLLLKWYQGDWVKVADYIPKNNTTVTKTSGALDLYAAVNMLSIDGTKAFTLAAGLFDGQEMDYVVIAAANTPDGTLTPAAFDDGTSIDVDALKESGRLRYDGDAWRSVHIIGATINA